MKHLIIIRHGNTFRADEIPLRVGARTDLPLVETERASNAGRILEEKGLVPDRVFAAPLKRTCESAELILSTMNLSVPVEKTDIFTEIDYGPDEAKTEEEVIKRLGRSYLEMEGVSDFTEEDILIRGKQVIEDWNARAVPPLGWSVDPTGIIRNWKEFASRIKEGETVLVVSSNGIIRFAPKILEPSDYEHFVSQNNLKVTTGGVCVLEQNEETWKITDWNLRRVKSEW